MRPFGLDGNGESDGRRRRTVDQDEAEFRLDAAEIRASPIVQPIDASDLVEGGANPGIDLQPGEGIIFERRFLIAEIIDAAALAEGQTGLEFDFAIVFGADIRA